ncbi:COG4705 family protein [Streptomyces niveus]|uniref:COG4705 family protein n=1 Tax=Streptomyces niveus TaxID=193462 RepID=UPI0033FF795B
MTTNTRAGRSYSLPRQMANKVPEVTLYFWVIKVLCTTVGETAADLLNADLGLGLVTTSYVMAGLLAVALVVQFRTRAYVPWVYWLALVLISVVGTLITDNLTDNLGVPLETTTAVFAVALVLTFAAWYLSERTLSIHTIRTGRREAFYWLAILFTFALGTAAGDLTAERLDVGYWLSALLFAGLIAVVAVAHYSLGLDAVWSFWIAYVLTRPLGASLGDHLSQPTADGGLGLGAVGTSVLFLAVILGLVVFLSRTKRDVAVAEPVSPRAG